MRYFICFYFPCCFTFPVDLFCVIFSFYNLLPLSKLLYLPFDTLILSCLYIHINFDSRQFRFIIHVYFYLSPHISFSLTISQTFVAHIFSFAADLYILFLPGRCRPLCLLMGLYSLDNFCIVLSYYHPNKKAPEGFYIYLLYFSDKFVIHSISNLFKYVLQALSLASHHHFRDFNATINCLCGFVVNLIYALSPSVYAV